VKKNIFISLVCLLFAFSSAHPLEVWVREASGDVGRWDINDFKALFGAINSDLLEAVTQPTPFLDGVVKIVIRGDNLPFNRCLSPDPLARQLLTKYIKGNNLKSGVDVIKRFPNLEQLVFENVDFFPEGGFSETSVTVQSAGTETKEFTYRPEATLKFLKPLKKLRVLHFHNCGFSEADGKQKPFRQLLAKENIIFPRLPSLRRVVATDGEGEDRVETELYSRPPIVSPWVKFLRWPGINWVARRMAGWLGRTVTFRADPGKGKSHIRPAATSIPQEAWKVSFIGYWGLYKVGDVVTVLENWEKWFEGLQKEGKGFGKIQHLTVEGGSLYWVECWRHFPSVRTIMMRKCQSVPSHNAAEIDWTDMKFPPMLEEVRIEGEDLSRDDIKELRGYLPAEVRLTVVE